MNSKDYLNNRIKYCKDLIGYYLEVSGDKDLSWTQKDFVLNQIGDLKKQIFEFELELQTECTH